MEELLPAIPGLLCMAFAVLCGSFSLLIGPVYMLFVFKTKAGKNYRRRIGKMQKNMFFLDDD